MKTYETSQIRNFCLLGQGNSGKTLLAETMLFTAGTIDRVGKTADGNTTMDFDSEEIKRQFSISSAVAACEWKNSKYNIIDAPGDFDFVGEVNQAVSAADAAIIVISGKSGLLVGAEKAWDYTEKQKMPKIIFVNKVDEEGVDYVALLEQLRAKYGKRIAPFQIPIREGDNIVGFINVVENEARRFEKGHTVTASIPEGMETEIEPVREMINEAVAESSEELMEKFFAGEAFTLEETYSALRSGVAAGDIVPVLCGSSVNSLGISSLMNAIFAYFPTCEGKTTLAIGKDGAEVAIPANSSDPVSLFVFKTVADPYVGKLSYFKVNSGTLTPDTTLYNPNSDSNEKIGKIFILQGKKQIEVDKLMAGDIGAVTKLSGTNTGDTLCAQGSFVKFPAIAFDEPNMALAIVPKAKGDEEKIGQGLNKLMEEDKTFKFYNNPETHQLIIMGLGDKHLDVIVSKLKNKFGVDVDLTPPRVAYRETIRKKTSTEYTHKKQSGGSGQYAKVVIEFEPNLADPNSSELLFEEKVFGGAVPRNFFTAVEKGIQESMIKGVLAGYPVVGLKATLTDGKHHPVDSNDMAFQLAARGAYKEGLAKASPALLEPIGTLKIYVPESYTGDIIGDINKRRGQMMGMTPQADGLTEIVAEVPMSEMHTYASDLRSITQGRGKFSLHFERYQDAPSNIADKVMKESKEG
ncbi:MAG: elongation factor G [Oscillospiraceae bacterium]|nr:elongation factor G [Oscillospiraceae bacterium]